MTCSLYPCAPGTPSDVTDEAVWESADAGILRVVGAGRFDAVGLGDTLMRARWQYTGGQRTVSVFPGLRPQPTGEIFGSVYDAVQAPSQKDVLEGEFTPLLLQQRSTDLPGWPRGCEDGDGHCQVSKESLPGVGGSFVDHGPDVHLFVGQPELTSRALRANGETIT